MPKAEILLWKSLYRKQLLGCKFRRQYGVGPYVIDFYCPALKIAIELDGDSHYQPGAAEHDAERQNYIESFGIEFLRFTNADIFEDLDGVLDRIAERITGQSQVETRPSGGKRK
jgi:very-short-patch-repair endonuclease